MVLCWEEVCWIVCGVNGNVDPFWNCTGMTTVKIYFAFSGILYNNSSSCKVRLCSFA